MTFSDIFLAESDGPFNGFTHLHGQQIVFRHTLIYRPCVEVLVRHPFRRRFPRNFAFADWIPSSGGKLGRQASLPIHGMIYPYVCKSMVLWYCVANSCCWHVRIALVWALHLKLVQMKRDLAGTRDTSLILFFLIWARIDTEKLSAQLLQSCDTHKGGSELYINWRCLFQIRPFVNKKLGGWGTAHVTRHNLHLVGSYFISQDEVPLQDRWGHCLREEGPNLFPAHALDASCPWLAGQFQDHIL